MKRTVEEILHTCSLIGEIRGRLGEHVFYMRGKRICVRRHVIPRNPRTIRQQENRFRFREAVNRWHDLNDSERDEYNQRAIGQNKSGYNLFLGEYLREKTNIAASIHVPSVRAVSGRLRPFTIDWAPDPTGHSHEPVVVRRPCCSYRSRAPDVANAEQAA